MMDNSHSARNSGSKLSWLLATQARQRMSIVASTSLLFGAFSAGTEVVFPLWVTKELGYTPSQWAQMRSMRMIGILVGILFLGALSDRFGQRLIGALSMLGAAACLILLGMGPRSTIWYIIPILGALVSTSFVNLNTLTQGISHRRQGTANAVYRSVGTIASIVAPVMATGLAAIWHGYSGVFYVFAGTLVAAACVLWFYPGEQIPESLGDIRKEMLRLTRGYRDAFKERQLMNIIHYSQIWTGVLAGVGVFAAIRFTRELGQTDQYFGLISSIAGALTFVSIAGTAFVLDRVSLPKLFGTLAVLSGLCSAVMGLNDSMLLATIGFLCFVPLTSVLVGPVSMWISRAADPNAQAAAFSVHKLISAAYTAGSIAILGYLEQKIGIRSILLYGGILGMLIGMRFFWLPEPGSPVNKLFLSPMQE